MSFEKPVLAWNLTAASDMTAASFQFCLLKVAATGVLPCTAVGDKVIGILQNQPKQGQQADIVMLGISKVRVGTTLAADDLISTDATGRAAVYVAGTTGTSSFMIGRVLAVDNATNTGGTVTALVNVLSMARGQ